MRVKGGRDSFPYDPEGKATNGSPGTNHLDAVLVPCPTSNFPPFGCTQLVQAKLDLEVSKNRRDGAKGEAQFIGANLKASDGDDHSPRGRCLVLI